MINFYLVAIAVKYCCNSFFLLEKHQNCASKERGSGFDLMVCLVKVTKLVLKKGLVSGNFNQQWVLRATALLQTHAKDLHGHFLWFQRESNLMKI